MWGLWSAYGSSKIGSLERAAGACAGACAGDVQVENKKPSVRPGLEVIVHDERFVISSALYLTLLKISLP